MSILRDNQGKSISLSEERMYHIESDHPEMESQFDPILETIADPDRIIRSRSDEMVELFYKHYPITPVSSKFLCIVVKIMIDENK